jgi:hypothetical protein
VVLFTDFFGCGQPTARLNSSPAQTPLSCAIYEIEQERTEGDDDEHPGEQHESSKHFLNKIDLQGDEGHNDNPQPLSRFLFVEYSLERLADRLTDSHLGSSFPGHKN